MTEPAQSADLVAHWNDCPLPPDANCQECWEYARRFLSGVETSDLGRGKSLPDGQAAPLLIDGDAGG